MLRGPPTFRRAIPCNTPSPRPVAPACAAAPSARFVLSFWGLVFRTCRGCTAPVPCRPWPGTRDDGKQAPRDHTRHPTGSCQCFGMIYHDLTAPMASPTRRAPRLAAARSMPHQSQEHHAPTLHTERLHNSVQKGQKNGHRVCKVRPVPEVRTRPRGACPVLPLARPSPGHDIRAEISTSPVPCVTPHRNCETLVGW
jgi:hypothetical protein